MNGFTMCRLNTNEQKLLCCFKVLKTRPVTRRAKLPLEKF